MWPVSGGVDQYFVVAQELKSGTRAYSCTYILITLQAPMQPEDPWEAFCRESWIPTLENSFGPDWRQHCPGEVAALMQWAVATRTGVPAATAAAIQRVQSQPVMQPAALQPQPLQQGSQLQQQQQLLQQAMHALLLPVPGQQQQQHVDVTQLGQGSPFVIAAILTAPGGISAPLAIGTQVLGAMVGKQQQQPPQQVQEAGNARCAAPLPAAATPVTSGRPGGVEAAGCEEAGLLQLLQRGLEARLAVQPVLSTPRVAPVAPDASRAVPGAALMGSGRVESGTAPTPTAVVAARASMGITSSTSGSGRTLPVLDLSRPPQPPVLEADGSEASASSGDSGRSAVTGAVLDLGTSFAGTRNLRGAV